MSLHTQSRFYVVLCLSSGSPQLKQLFHNNRDYYQDGEYEYAMHHSKVVADEFVFGVPDSEIEWDRLFGFSGIEVRIFLTVLMCSDDSRPLRSSAVRFLLPFRPFPLFMYAW